MSRWFLKAGGLGLVFAAPLLLSPEARAQGDNVKTEQKQDEAKTRSRLRKTHFDNGNQAMRDAQAIRQKVQAAANEQRSAMLANMTENYQTAIAEYQQALQDTEVRDENGIQVIGLIGVIRNGLVTQQKAVDMLVQDKDLPVLLSNLGMAYGGTGEYQQAINMLEQAAILKPAAATYMELGTDFAQLGKTPEATATCDKILTVDPAAQKMLAGCYKNVAIVLTNQGKLAEAIRPLEKATELNPQDPQAWKLFGDALTSTIATKSEGGNTVYVIPPGAIEAYQKYLQLEPSGPYAGQVQAALEGLAQLTKPVSKQKDPKVKN
jgi:tetratricopeptide (TPR) repeat protein